MDKHKTLWVVEFLDDEAHPPVWVSTVEVHITRKEARAKLVDLKGGGFICRVKKYVRYE